MTRNLIIYAQIYNVENTFHQFLKIVLFHDDEKYDISHAAIHKFY